MTRPASFQTDTTAGGRERESSRLLLPHRSLLSLSLPIDEVRTTRIVAKGDRQRGKLRGEGEGWWKGEVFEPCCSWGRNELGITRRRRRLHSTAVESNNEKRCDVLFNCFNRGCNCPTKSMKSIRRKFYTIKGLLHHYFCSCVNQN